MGIELNPLSTGVTAPDTGVSKSNKRLADAAKQFESLMIDQMMKTVRESSGGGWLNDGDQTGEDSSMGMAEEQFANAMASSGGLGLAKMIVKTMSQPETKPI
jgi:Rod binding domain-containing protein